MSKQRLSDVGTVCMVLAVFLSLSSPAAALRCYQCVSGEGWSDCHSNAIQVTCDGISSVSFLGKDIFLPAQSRQLEPACLGLAAEGTVGGTKGYAYLRQCFFNDKSLCSLIQSDLPEGFKIISCDLCTTDLCNSATSVRIAFSSVLLMAFALLLRN